MAFFEDSGGRAMWRTVMVATAFLAGACPLLIAGNGLAVRFGFDKADLNKVPKGWQAAQTGKGSGSFWKVVADDSTPSKTGHALAQTAASPKSMFNLCVLEKSDYRDVEVSVPFLALAGKEDQGGGIVWRYQDADNYYVARANPLEDNFRLYKVVNGKRIQLATADDVVIPAKKWHTITIRHAGDKIVCSLNGKKLLEATDNTIAAAGRVGLWTKADAQTQFDALMIRDLKK
jgi:hypothetical protein